MYTLFSEVQGCIFLIIIPGGGKVFGDLGWKWKFDMKRLSFYWGAPILLQENIYNPVHTRFVQTSSQYRFQWINCAHYTVYTMNSCIKLTMLKVEEKSGRNFSPSSGTATEEDEEKEEEVPISVRKLVNQTFFNLWKLI